MKRSKSSKASEKLAGRVEVEEPASIGASQTAGSMEIRIGHEGQNVTITLEEKRETGRPLHVSTICLNKPLAKLVAKAIEQNADALK